MARGDSILFEKSYGYADRGFGIKHSKDSKFLIGSVTKPFTAYGILLLEQQGKLALAAPLSKYFPEFLNTNNVTIKQLLTHTSGINDYHALSDWKEDSKRDITPLYTVNKMVGMPYRSMLGTGFSYSNTG